MTKQNDCRPCEPQKECDGLDVAVAICVDLDLKADVDLFECGKLIEADAGLCLDLDASVGIG